MKRNKYLARETNRLDRKIVFVANIVRQQTKQTRDNMIYS